MYEAEGMLFFISSPPLPPVLDVGRVWKRDFKARGSRKYLEKLNVKQNQPTDISLLSLWKDCN